MKRFIQFLPSLCAIFLILSCSHDSVVTPELPKLAILSVSPNAAAAGAQMIKVEISGMEFAAASTVDMGPDIKIVEQEIPDTQHIKITIKVGDAATPGSRTLIVSNGTSTAQLTNAFRIEKNAIPLASFTFDPPSGTQNTIFTFDASTSKDREGPIRRYLWDFGDGDSANGVRVKHKFNQEGDYKVALTVIDSDMADSVARKKLKVRFFDRDQAIKEINALLVQFLTLFGQIETLSPDQICVGFSQHPSCPGRAHEISTIEREEPLVEQAFVTVYGPATVTYVDETTARATLQARFYGTYKDGSRYDGVATHDFFLNNEADGWRICDYILR